MKDARSIGKARNARLNQTVKHAKALLENLLEHQGTQHDVPITDGVFWEDTREIVGRIAQCFHEANAYNNVMVPDGETFEREFFEIKTPDDAS